MTNQTLHNDNTPLVETSRLASALETFATERDWHQFHSPKNLVMALSGEVGELTEIFQWMSEDASKNAGSQPATADKVREELADVLLYLVRLADVLGVDLNDAASKKLQLNTQKYPADKVRGSSKKYNEI
ncbi:nucleotide pyrophosphohydrolase [Chromobacterium haemolyticum]|uniref:nucleotide pyrophosphohydrolase n=1 Tax=Chromobacterium haemolyticum TaxID=394935 RepID=UPI001316ECEE|nr:nucleotide pyrophosphohydrolase [Chromobacterium haemolyticum]BBH13276.1 nucleotide pyrophosphohydrolase [Chromobacterium haemolyticum]